MYIQIKNIKLMYDTQDAKIAIGAEVEYKVVLKEGQRNRTSVTTNGQTVKVVNIPDDEVKGTIILMNGPELVDIADWSLWDFNNVIYSNITRSLGGQ